MNPESTEAGSGHPHGKGNVGESSTPAGKEWDPVGTTPLDSILEQATKKRRWLAADEYVLLVIIGSACSCMAAIFLSNLVYLLRVQGAPR